MTNVVVNGDPFHCKVEPLANPEPVTVRVNAGPPAVALAGFNEEIVETGELMVNVTALEIAPVVLSTVTLAAPTETTKLAGTLAVNWVLLTKVVVRGAPFHCTVEPLAKPVPLTVRVNPRPPAVTAAGLRLLMLKVGATTGVPAIAK